jgi:nitroreductase
MQALDALLNRVSVARLTEPAPDAAQRELMLRAALRAPDHGQLRPWRFIEIEGAGLQALGELFADALMRRDPAVAQAALDKARNMPLRAPLLLVVVASPQAHPKVPRDEQIQSAACAAHAILLAAHAQGVGAIWRTGEMASDRHVAQSLGLSAEECILAFLYLGAPQGPLRVPQVLEPQAYLRRWTGR